MGYSLLATEQGRTSARGFIIAERERQERLKEAGRFAHTCADPEMTDLDCAAVLMEEVGEVARAIIEHKPAHEIEAEVIQVGAVALAWVERFEAERFTREWGNG